MAGIILWTPSVTGCSPFCTIIAKHTLNSEEGNVTKSLSGNEGISDTKVREETQERFCMSCITSLKCSQSCEMDACCYFHCVLNVREWLGIYMSLRSIGSLKVSVPFA